ncbi:Uncharacterized protein PCOAH_00048140 [Plasmodium coatneyi]|uniref:Pv-fam-d protein n=1 Tax=Plasmodium coatneyi TaxID=208452 RepID=A0A1B1E6H3_9APIC|nr:Uncharacterized protein PCOAH_00048140 [Plasmodium coatneyi]ANQ10567.1 Uncharacterized protein PCOAH_00048140 [Plasmodium coatneyi]
MKGNNKGIYFLNFLMLAILATPWKYSKEITTDLGESQDRIINPRTILNCRNGRLLRGDIDIDLEVKYDLFKDKIVNVVDEDDYAFENRVKSVMQDDKFRECFNKIKCNESSHRSDNFNDSYENVLSYDQFYDSCQKNDHNLDQFYDSCESINSSDKSSNKNNYDDEDEELGNTYYTVAHSGVPQYNAKEYEMPLTGTRRHRKKSIFSRIFKFLKKQDAKYEKYIYNTLNGDIPQNVKNLLDGIISPELMKFVNVLTIFFPVISISSLLFLVVIMSYFVSATIMAPLICIFIGLLIIVFMPIFYKYEKLSMKERTDRKSHFFTITLTVTLFISTWRHIYDSLSTANAWDKRVLPQNITLHTGPGRILRGDIEPETQQQYTALKERIINLLDEDDESFRERLNALAQDDHFRKQFNALMRDGLSQKGGNKIILDKFFHKHVNILNESDNNLEKNPFLISPDVNHSNHDNSDPFKFYNSLEELSDELKSKNYYKAKIIDELKRHEEYKEKRKSKIKRTNNLKREPTNGTEHAVLSKLEKDDIFEGFLHRYAYEELVKPRKRSMLPTFLKKADKKLKAKVKRFLKKKTPGRYADNGQDIMGKSFLFVKKFRVFIPILFFLPLVILATPLIIYYTFVFQTSILAMFSLVGIYPPVLPILFAALIAYGVFNLIVRPRRSSI